MALVIEGGIAIEGGISIDGEFLFPYPVDPPVISGSSVIGSKLTTTNGTWETQSTVDGYYYQWFNGTVPISGATNNYLITSTALTGANIKCMVTAYNTYGSFSNLSSNSIGPLTYPGYPQPPTNVFATRTSSTSASVAFDIPTDNGGASIIGYRVTAYPSGATRVGSSSPINFTALTSGRDYYFTVTAYNANGDGVPSQPSNSVAIFPDIGEYIYGGYYAGLSSTSDSTTNRLLIVSDRSVGTFFGTWANANTLCGNLVSNGYSDWGLPVIDDLAQMCSYKGIFAGIGQGYNTTGSAGSHWSATSVPFSSFKYYVFFGNCSQSSTADYSTMGCRAARRQSVSKT